MGRRRVTTDELLARAEANRYKKGTNKDKGEIRDAGKHVERPKMIRMRRCAAVSCK
jgi:hypothetical protein